MNKLSTISVVALLACCASACAAPFDPMHPLPMPPGVGVFFNPGDHIEDRVIELIKTAKREILVNQYAITSQKIAAALVDAYQKNRVLVSVVLEAEPAITNYQTPLYFRINEIPVMVFKGQGYDNNKYMIIDRQVVVTGSYDFTNAAANKNSENLLVLADPAVVVAYFNNWVAMAHQSRIPTSTP